MNNMKLYVIAEDVSRQAQAQIIADTLRVPLLKDDMVISSGYALFYGQEKVSIKSYSGKKISESFVDFVAGAKAHRRKFGGGKGQAIAKAVGLNKASAINVLDATAGMGGDAFVLASLGCTVAMVERSPIVCQLLSDGLERARIFASENDSQLAEVLARMSLLPSDSLSLQEQNKVQKPQVVYLDPMFPERKKSAEVKKEMRFFHELVGADADADALLPMALELAKNRVVVKRPKIAPYLANMEPGYQLVGKSNRFDIYPIKALDK